MRAVVALFAVHFSVLIFFESYTERREKREEREKERVNGNKSKPRG